VEATIAVNGFLRVTTDDAVAAIRVTPAVTTITDIAAIRITDAVEIRDAVMMALFDLFR